MRSLQTAWYWFIRTFVRYCYFVLTGGFKVNGKENVPKTGPLIIAPNHESYLDPPAAGCALPRILTFMAKEELFRFKPMSILIRSLGAFPVKRGTSDIESIRIALSILEEGKALLVFPEGTRNLGEQMMPMNRGVEMLAKRSGALIVPVGITGTHTKWGKHKKLKLWGKVVIRFGEPLNYAEFADRKDEFAPELERRILALCHESGFQLKSAAENQPSKKTASDDASSATSHP